MSLLAKEIAKMSSRAPIAIFVTSACLYSVVDHFRDSYKAYSPSTPFYYRFVHKQNLPLLLPRMSPLEKGHIAVTITLSMVGSLKTFWYSWLISNKLGLASLITSI